MSASHRPNMKVVLVLAAACLPALALQLPFLAAPFGLEEINAGCYFGPFAQSWERYGFGSLRGVPLVVSPYKQPAAGLVYLNHPPGTAWLLGGWGSAPWSLRLPSALGLALACGLLAGFLRTHLGTGRALAAGLLLGALPVLGFHAQVSYETLVLPAGLAALLAADRLRSGGARWWPGLLAASALLGPWLDWAYLFFIPALAPLLLGRPRGLRHLVLAGGLALLSTAGVLLWRSWALESTLLENRTLPEVGSVAATVLSSRLSAAGLLAASWRNLSVGLTLPVLLAALPGAAWLLARRPRPGLALLIAGILNPLVFSRHAEGHVFYYAYLAPLAAAGVAALPAPGRRLLPALAAVQGAVILWAAAATVRTHDRAHVPFFADLGRAIDEAAADRDAAGRIRRVYRVHHDAPQVYPYYTRAPFLTPTTAPEGLKAARRRPADTGLRFLHLRISGPVPGVPYEELQDYLEPFPSRRLPRLEGTFTRPLTGQRYQVTEARVYTLRL